MPIKQVKGVIVPRHDTATNWSKAINFIPKKGELIVYDADAEGVTYDTSVIIGTIECSIKSSNKVRFKFGDGKSNINVLPFATTEKSGGSSEGGFTEEEIIEIIKEYSENEAAAIIYLNTQEHIGRTLELQDVYPIQAQDTKLQIISKNRIKYNTIEDTTDGIKVTVSLDNGVKVTGSAEKDVNKTISVGTVDVTIPGKYTITVNYDKGANNNGVYLDGKKCFIKYSLIDSNGVIIKSDTMIGTEPVLIDSKELNCVKIDISLYIEATSGVSFNTSAAQTFKPQVEYGEVATTYTVPKTENDMSGKKINIFGKNLYSASWLEPIRNYIKINDVEVPNGLTEDIHYVKGVMTKDNEISLTTEGESHSIYTPLLTGDKFTFIYTYNQLFLRNIQIVYGHVDYSEYEPYETDTTESQSDGICDIKDIKYPYSFLALEDGAANEGYAIYLRYDPALSRNWTEKQLLDLNKRIDTLESIIKSLTN